MFETRLHFIQALDAPNKRKMWEGWLQWANRLSSIDSDNIARGQLGRRKFNISAFLEMFHDGHTVSEDDGVVSNESGTYIAASKKIVSLDVNGEYWVTWSLYLTADDGECRFVGGVPYIGNTFVSSAQDFKAEFGWYNNSDVTEAVTRTPEWMGGASSDDISEILIDNYDSYGMRGVQRDTKTSEPGNRSKHKRASQLKNSISQKDVPIHLSGAGAVNIGRSTGNVGVLLFCQPGSSFKIKASRLTIHRRIR